MEFATIWCCSMFSSYKSLEKNGSTVQCTLAAIHSLNSVCTVKGVKAMQSSLVAECGLNSVCDVVVGVIAAV